jgi:hypothetical protein
MEMSGEWKNEETKPRFPLVSHRPWKSLRDSKILTAPTGRGKVENRKQVSQLFSNPTSKGGPAADRFASAFRLVLQ